MNLFILTGFSEYRIPAGTLADDRNNSDGTKCSCKIQKKSETGSRGAGESDHSVRLEVHGRVRFDMVALVNGTCQIDRVIFIAVDAEDLLRARLDLADVIHQLPAIRVPREPVNCYDL